MEAADSRDDLREIAAEIVSLHGAANITNYEREFERRKRVQSIVEAGKMTLEHAEMAVGRIGAGEGNLKDGDGDTGLRLQLQEAQSSLRRALSEREALAHQLNDVLDRCESCSCRRSFGRQLDGQGLRLRLRLAHHLMDVFAQGARERDEGGRD